jgi:hypothetical protein
MLLTALRSTLGKFIKRLPLGNLLRVVRAWLGISGFCELTLKRGKLAARRFVVRAERLDRLVLQVELSRVFL